MIHIEDMILFLKYLQFTIAETNTQFPLRKSPFKTHIDKRIFDIMKCLLKGRVQKEEDSNAFSMNETFKNLHESSVKRSSSDASSARHKLLLK